MKSRFTIPVLVGAIGCAIILPTVVLAVFLPGDTDNSTQVIVSDIDGANHSISIGNTIGQESADSGVGVGTIMLALATAVLGAVAGAVGGKVTEHLLKKKTPDPGTS